MPELSLYLISNSFKSSKKRNEKKHSTSLKVCVCAFSYLTTTTTTKNTTATKKKEMIAHFD